MGRRWCSPGCSSRVMADGGHFERSPMYHSIILEDLLDLLNLFAAYPEALPERWRSFAGRVETVASKMQGWLAGMTHPDGDIALFNDAAFGIAPSPAELDAYAERLGLVIKRACLAGMQQMADSGYVRYEGDGAVLIADVGEIGPDYLPGHAHADTLGFEMSLFGQRLFVDSGTSCYGSGRERVRQRSTSAHNTVVIDGEDSSEVWGGFRVARRARPRSFRVVEEDERVLIYCEHDGFTRLPGRPIHGREWILGDRSLRIRDTISGKFGSAVARYHLHPDIAVETGEGGKEGYFIMPGDHRLVWRLEGGTARILPSTYHAPANRTFEHCREWVKAGHRVTVITCVPNFPKGKVFDGYKNRPWQTETMEGIRVVRVWSYLAANRGKIRRTLDYLSYMVSAILAAPFVKRPDLVVATSPQFFTAVAGYVVGATRRIPFVFELRDLWPISIKAVGAVKDGSYSIHLLGKLEMFLYRKAARIVSVTNSFATVLIDRGIDGGKIDVVTNGVDLSRFKPQPKDPELVNPCARNGTGCGR